MNESQKSPVRYRFYVTIADQHFPTEVVACRFEHEGDWFVFYDTDDKVISLISDEWVIQLSKGAEVPV